MPKRKLSICLLYIIIISVVITVTACSQVVIEPNRYYILEYKGLKGDATLLTATKQTFGVNISDADVAGTYNRKQIVRKTSENQIRYDLKNLWAERLPSSVANLVHQRISSYNLFTRVVRDYQQQTRYDVSINIKALEFINYDTIKGARIDLDISLKRNSDNLIVFMHSANRYRNIPVNDTEMFVQTIHDLLLEETDKFLVSLLANIGTVESSTGAASQIFTSKDFTDTKKTNQQETIEDDYVSVLGRLYVPFLTDPEHEPSFIIEDLEGNFIDSHPMGTEVHLEEGTYNVLLGNGTTGQKVVEQVEIQSRYKTILEPNIGGLVVNIIDRSRNLLDRRYELFDLETAESYGFGFGIKEGVGQQLETWVLRPSHYKIVLNDHPFNTYIDFTTVEVKQGEVERLTLVVDDETFALLGAGRLSQEDIVIGKNRTSFSIMNHLNGIYKSSNETQKNENKYTLEITEQLDTKLVLDYFPYNFTMKNWIEAGVSTDSDTDLKMQYDTFDLKNTFIYYFFTNLGLYSRADLNTHLFPEYVYTKDETNYIRIDKKGNETIEQTDRFQVKESLMPLTIKEGVGLNWRMLNYNRANLNLRAGIGFKQDYYTNAYFRDKNDRDVDGVKYPVFRARPDVFEKGTELSATGSFQIFRDLNYTLYADALKPFGNNEVTFEVENILNLRLFKYVSWDYRLNLQYNKYEKDYVEIEHTLFLRFTYIFVK